MFNSFGRQSGLSTQIYSCNRQAGKSIFQSKVVFERKWEVLGGAEAPTGRCDEVSMLLFPVSAQAPNSAITAQTGVGVASTVHLNPMQLMTVDASHARHIQGIQPAPISAQGIQPAPISAQGIQPAPIGTQGLHPAAPIGTQGLQPAPISAQQPQADTKTSGKSNQQSPFFGPGQSDWICPANLACLGFRLLLWLMILL